MADLMVDLHWRTEPYGD